MADYNESYNYSNRVCSIDYQSDIRKSCCNVCFGYTSIPYDRVFVKNGKQYHFQKICADCKDEIEFLFYKN